MLTLNTTFFIVCFGFFVWQVALILISFAEKETSIAIKTEDTNILSKKLPCLTFCPESGYKNVHTFHKDIVSYDEDTFGKEDIFTNKTYLEFRNESKWFVKEIYTVMLGRCTMTCYQRNVSVADLVDPPKILLNGSRNYQVNLFKSLLKFSVALISKAIFFIFYFV